MNERIKQLVKQCGGLHFDDDNEELTPMLCGDSLEKFAELIVQECTEVGSQWADGLFDTNHYAFVNKQIKRYFGVEQ